MFDSSAAAWLYAALTATFIVMASSMGWAAARNHFRSHKMRPAVVAETGLFASLAAYFGLRVGAQLLLASSGVVGAGTALLTGPLGDAALLAVVVMSVWTFATLVFAYPEAHDYRPEDISPGGTDD